MTRMADEGHTVGVSYRKFVNAFNFVIHKFLLAKVTPFGFGDIVVGGIEVNLTECASRVLSGGIPMGSCVPQLFQLCLLYS